MYEVYERLRNEKGVTDYRVARETHITPSTFTEWKKGTYKPKVDKLQEIANYFGVTLEYLLTGKEDKI